MWFPVQEKKNLSEKQRARLGRRLDPVLLLHFDPTVLLTSTIHLESLLLMFVIHLSAILFRNNLKLKGKLRSVKGGNWLMLSKSTWDWEQLDNPVYR